MESIKAYTKVPKEEKENIKKKDINSPTSTITSHYMQSSMYDEPIKKGSSVLKDDRQVERALNTTDLIEHGLLAMDKRISIFGEILSSAEGRDKIFKQQSGLQKITEYLIKRYINSKMLKEEQQYRTHTCSTYTSIARLYLKQFTEWNFQRLSIRVYVEQRSGYLKTLTMGRQQGLAAYFICAFQIWQRVTKQINDKAIWWENASQLCYIFSTLCQFVLDFIRLEDQTNKIGYIALFSREPLKLRNLQKIYKSGILDKKNANILQSPFTNVSRDSFTINRSYANIKSSYANDIEQNKKLLDSYAIDDNNINKDNDLKNIEEEESSDEEINQNNGTRSYSTDNSSSSKLKSLLSPKGAIYGIRSKDDNNKSNDYLKYFSITGARSASVQYNTTKQNGHQYFSKDAEKAASKTGNISNNTILSQEKMNDKFPDYPTVNATNQWQQPNSWQQQIQNTINENAGSYKEIFYGQVDQASRVYEEEATLRDDRETLIINFIKDGGEFISTISQLMGWKWSDLTRGQQSLHSGCISQWRLYKRNKINIEAIIRAKEVEKAHKQFQYEQALIAHKATAGNFNQNLNINPINRNQLNNSTT